MHGVRYDYSGAFRWSARERSHAAEMCLEARHFIKIGTSPLYSMFTGSLSGCAQVNRPLQIDCAENEQDLKNAEPLSIKNARAKCKIMSRLLDCSTTPARESDYVRVDSNGRL